MTNLTEPFLHTHRQMKSSLVLSEYCAQKLVNVVLQDVASQIKRKQYLTKNLSNYASQKSFRSISEVTGLHLDELSKYRYLNNHQQESEPQALLIDSLLPSSADINEENTYKKNLEKSNMGGGIQNNHSLKKIEKDNAQINTEVYTKLKINEQEEDGFTKQLRKMQEEKVNKIQNQRKAKENQEKARLAKLKQKKDKKNTQEEKVTYDYNGQVFNVRNQTKANLIANIVKDKINNFINTSKRAEINPDPTPVQFTKNKRDSKKNNMVSIKRNELIEFSETKSLAENVKIISGVKYSHNSIVIEQRRRIVGIQELKRTLTSRKLSMEEYKRIKSLTGSRQQFDENLKKSKVVTERESTFQLRSQSESKLDNSKLSKIKRSSIIINNQDLRDSLLEVLAKPSPEQYLQPQELPTNLNTSPKLDDIDNYNMQYMQSGDFAEANSKGTKATLSNTLNNKLPKINHTGLNTKTLPKNRQKIKDSAEIIRQIRKKFQDKLRT